MINIEAIKSLCAIWLFTLSQKSPDDVCPFQVSSPIPAAHEQANSPGILSLRSMLKYGIYFVQNKKKINRRFYYKDKKRQKFTKLS